ncbi:MAG: T9SS type A sorting domain-containing protein [bacterium]
MKFTDSLTGYGITKGGFNGDSDYVIKTTNSGNNWFIVYTTYSAMNKVKFLNSNTGFICGSDGWGGLNGLVLKTTNGGINWIFLNTYFAKEFRDMSVLNEDTIWVADPNGFNGGIYRTNNGGINWFTQFYTFGSNPEKIYMYNAQMGFMNKSDFLFKTTNGGYNWSRISGQNAFYDIFFVDSLTGWKCKDSVRKTTDGGITWIRQNVINPNYLNMFRSIVSFSNIGRDTIYGVGAGVEYPNLQGRGIVHKTTNGGENWFFQIPDTSLRIGEMFISNFINNLTGWEYSFGKGIYTNSGGDSIYYPITEINSNNTKVADSYSLFQNYPNPFNPRTKINYKISKRSQVVLKVYNITGNLITTIVDKKQSKGEYEVEFDGRELSSGVYFYSLFLDERIVDSKKMILLR